jgi:hypothetical protein
MGNVTLEKKSTDMNLNQQQTSVQVMSQAGSTTMSVQNALNQVVQYGQMLTQ